MLHAERPIDIIVYGATGFTGRLVCQHFKERYFDNVSSADRIELAIGGRSSDKLEKLKSELGFKSDDVKTFVADSFDQAALNQMCKQTKAVVTLVGPYALYGDALIAACVENGTHYFDLTGETVWVSRQISKLERRAKQSKTLVFHSCGFDSIPGDLNAMLAVKELKEAGGGDVEVGTVTSGARAKGGVSGGTLASMFNLYDEGISTLRKSLSCYLLSPVQGLQKSSGPWITREPGLTGCFFMMAPHNGAVVRRSWGLLESASDEAIYATRYGDNFSYDEFLITPGSISAFLATLFFKIIGLVLFLPQVRMLLRRFGPQSGEGPNEKARNTGWFEHITTAHSVDDEVQVRVTMYGTRDPGYGWTSIGIAECAISVIKNYDQLPSLARNGGFLTPATGLGDVLLKRLESVQAVRITKEVLKNERKKSK